ncbi:hypothetical protein CHH49_00650 [Terribacillus saccharophilus]|nr:hypothetical protein CHH49_00650 [Terribacillus saccharophilus]
MERRNTLMNPLEIVRIAFKSIIGHKLRSVLTVLGLIIGVSATTVIIGLGQIAENSLTKQFLNSGENIITINYNPVPRQEDYNASEIDYEMSPTITEQDITELRRSDNIKTLILSNSTTATLHDFKNDTIDVEILGLEEDTHSTNEYSIIEGKNLTSYDFNNIGSSILISEDFADRYFPDGEAIGDIIDISGYPMKVKGIYKNPDDEIVLNTNQAILPLNLYQNVYKSSTIDNIEVEAYDTETIEKAGTAATEVLNRNLGEEYTGQFEVLDLEELQKGITGLTTTMTFLIGGIASISLLVAGIGVMNIMLVTVTERTNEIGIRKALGATRRVIMFQFLVESSMLTLIGGVLGIILAYSMITILSMVFNWAILISPWLIVIAVMFLVLFGILCGILPANKAAKLVPVEALRRE